MTVHIHFLCNSPKLETIQISVNRLMDQQYVVYPHSRIVLSNRKEWTCDICNNMGESQSNYT